MALPRVARRLYKLHEVDQTNPFFKSRHIDVKDLPTQKLLKIVRENGPVKTNDIWSQAQKEGIKSKTHMKKLLHWLESKFLIHAKCKVSTQTNAKAKGRAKTVEHRDFKWVAVPPPPTTTLVLEPREPTPRLYRERRRQKRLKKLKAKFGDAYVRPGRLKKQRLAQGIVYKPFKYGDPKLLKAAQSWRERRAIVLDAVAARTRAELEAQEA